MRFGAAWAPIFKTQGGKLMYNTVFFDLDGTLTDPVMGITNSVIYSLKKFGIEVTDRKSLYKFVGPPLMDSYAKYYGFSREQCVKAIEYYREYFSVKGLYENDMFKDTPWLLKELKEHGKTVILATSKAEKYSVQILEHFDIAKYFDCIAGASMDASRNKKADVIAYAMERCGINSPDGCVMVGDREHDIIGAQENGMDSIGVLFGYGDHDELKAAGSTHIVKDMKGILDVVLN